MSTHIRPTTLLPMMIAVTCLIGSAILVGARPKGRVTNSDPPPHPSATASPASAAAGGEGSLSVYFSPNGGAVAAMVREIAQARHTVLVQQYELALPAVVNALIAAHRRGVAVTVVLDPDEFEDDAPAPDTMAAAGVPVFFDGMYSSAHNKIMVIDQTVITGSLNLNVRADNENAENILIIHGQPALAEAYRKNFQMHLAYSCPYPPTTGPDTR